MRRAHLARLGSIAKALNECGIPVVEDSDEAADQAEEFLQGGPLLTYYEKVLIEALKLAQDDAERGLLDNERMTRVRDTVIEIVDDLSAHQDKDLAEAAVDDAEERGPLAHIALAEETLARDDKEIPLNWRTGKHVLCVPGSGILDEAFTTIVAQAIGRQGIGVRTEARDALSVSRVFTLDTSDVELLCVCYLATVTTAQIRYSLRRLRRRVPDRFILVTMAGAGDVDRTSLFPSGEQGNLVQESLTETVTNVRLVAVGTTKVAESASNASAEPPVASHKNVEMELHAS
jgi:hypothetical protein